MHPPASSTSSPLPVAPLLSVAGFALLGASVAVGLIPATAFGAECGSPFLPARNFSAAEALCADARGGRWPWIIILGIFGLAVLFASAMVRTAPSAPTSPTQAPAQPAEGVGSGLPPIARAVWGGVAVLVLVAVVAMVLLEQTR